jgi:2-oxoisovalerate dehydrogenase E2 component (dihydrolipoyl transacylase)
VQGGVDHLPPAQAHVPDGELPVPGMPGELGGLEAGHPAGPGDDASEPPAAAPEAAPGPLVGTGPKADAVKRRPRKAPAAGAGPELPSPAANPPANPPAGAPAAQPVEADTPSRSNPLNQLINRVLAKPPVRKAARDLGINLADVPATGSAGEVTKQDLMSYQSQRDAEQDGADSFWADRKLLGGGRIERIPVKGVRKATAKAMVQSAFTAPHVSIFVDVDASRTMEFVKRLKASRDFEGIRVSPLLILSKAVIWAAARNPSVNATWAEDEIHVKHFMNLGIAAATPRGLMVPNIKDAQDLSLKELALALNDLATTARAGKTQPAQMQGGTLTITNIGALGIDTGTPIINPGEVAIVAFGTIKQKPWVLDGEVIPRWITTLGGSFDHRVVDGDLSARFMADVASILEEPALLLD